MKKKLVVLLSVVFAASILLCACGKDNKQNKTNTNNESEITNDTNVSDEVTNSTETDTIVDDTETSSTQTPSNSKEEATENNNTTKPSSATTNSNNTTNSSNTTKPSTNQQHTHNYANATCTTAKKCSCGATSGNALGHSYSNATCTTAKKCIRCGTTSGSALGHDYKKGVCSRCQAKDLNYVPSKYEQNLQVLKDYILANGLGSSGDYKFIYTTDKRQLSSYSIYIYYYMKEDMIEFQLTSGSTEWLDFKVSQIENSDIKVSYRERSSSKYNPKVIALASATINTNTYDGLSDIFFEYTLDEYGDESQATPNYYLRIGVENWKKLLLKANLTMNDLGFVSCK